MPPIVKKLIAFLVILALANIGFVLYGQASFDATFQQMSRAFAERNATCGAKESLPPRIERFMARHMSEKSRYKTLVMQWDGLIAPKQNDRFKPIHTLILVGGTPDLLQAMKIDANSLVTFNALESYHNGHAKLQSYLFGIIPTGTLDSEAFTRSELAKTLALAVFNPELFRCDAISYRTKGRCIEATLKDGDINASVDFCFTPGGEIAEVVSRDRVRMVDKKPVLMPWHLQILAYDELDGLLIPTDIEERWETPKGSFIHAKYRVTDLKRL